MTHTEAQRLAPKQDLQHMISNCKWSQQIWLASDCETSAYLYASSEQAAKIDFEAYKRFYSTPVSKRKKGIYPSGNIEGITAKLIY